MNTRLENYMSMVVRVRDFLVEHVLILTPLNKYTETKTSYDGHITELQTTSMQQQSNNKGRALLKKQRKFELISFTMQVVSILIAYATFEEKPDLLTQINYNRSKLMKLAINSLREKTLEVWEVATALQAALDAYGLRDAHLDNLAAAIEAFELVMQKPQESKSLRKELTARLKLLRKALDTDLDKLDKLVDLLREIDLVLHTQYYNMRRIDDNGRTKIALTASTIDSITGAGLENAKYTFEPADTGVKEAGSPEFTKSVKFTSINGGFRIKSLPTGTYSCTVELKGYITQTFNVYVNAGVLTRVKVALVKTAQ
jgi:hypothetical protein